MGRQDYLGPVEWVIVDDGPSPAPLGKLRKGWRRTVIRPEPFWTPGVNTQGRNLWVGLNAAEELARRHGYDLRLTVVEDDDWYHPSWLTVVNEKLSSNELVGEAPARYYNVRWRQYQHLQNFNHTSLRCTAMRGAALKVFREVLKTPHIYYDWRLWLACERGFLFDTKITVGIKGLPGPLGVASGHQEEMGKNDRDLAVLRDWIGDDVRLYEEFYDMAHDMKARTMVALKPFKYGTRKLVAGEQFEVNKKGEAQILAIAKLADFKDKSYKKIRKPAAPTHMPIPETTVALLNDELAPSSIKPTAVEDPMELPASEAEETKPKKAVGKRV